MDILIPVIIVGVLGLAFGLLLAYASQKFKVEVDPRTEKIREVLPGANCGACGYTGCDGFASGIVENGANIELCSVGGNKVAQDIGQIMGVNVDSEKTLKARVLCKGTFDKISQKYEYKGVTDCAAASMLYSGPGSCSYGCLGFGDCVRVCQFDAINIIDGVACIDEEKCTACGLCVPKCPKGIITLVHEGIIATVRCSNKDKGAESRKVCTVSCIACGKCVKVCETGAMTMENNLAVINYEKCNDCGECARVCPTNACDRGLELK